MDSLCSEFSFSRSIYDFLATVCYIPCCKIFIIGRLLCLCIDYYSIVVIYLQTFYEIQQFNQFRLSGSANDHVTGFDKITAFNNFDLSV